MEFNKDLYNLLFFSMVANQTFSETKDIQKKLPNRVEIIRDFDNLFYKKKFNDSKIYEQNNITLSNDLLFSKLQKIIFKKIKNEYSYNETKEIILNDLSSNSNLSSNNIYDIANFWCKQKYGLI